MTYLIVQILLWMVLALVVGAFLGWVLRGKNADIVAEGLKGKAKELEVRLGQCEKERSVSVAKFRQSEALVLKRDATIKELKQGGAKVAASLSPAINHSPRITALEADLESCRRQRELLKAQIEERDERISQLVSELGTAAVRGSKKQAAIKDVVERPDALPFGDSNEVPESMRGAAVLASDIGEAAKGAGTSEQVFESAAQKPNQNLQGASIKDASERSDTLPFGDEHELAVTHAATDAATDTITEAAIADETETAADTAAKMFQTPPEKPDNLKKMTGVGPKLASALNEIGIYTFEQLAAFDEADKAWVDGQLSAFKGKIYRDDWVGQAQKLLAE